MNAPNNVNGVGDVGRDEVYTLAHDDLTAVQERLARKIVTELNAFDNLYFEITNEPYQGTVTREFEDRIAQVIDATEAVLPNRHLISMNIANRSKKIEDPNPFVSIFNFHYAIPPETVAMNAHVRGVIGDNETGFEGHGRTSSTGPRAGPSSWPAAASTAASTTPSPPPTRTGPSSTTQSPGGGSPALRKQLGILKRLRGGLRLRAHGARTGRVVGGVPEGLEAWALVEPGRQYAVYVLERAGGRSFAARWTARLDPPATGEYTFTTVSDDGVRLWVDDDAGRRELDGPRGDRGLGPGAAHRRRARGPAPRLLPGHGGRGGPAPLDPARRGHRGGPDRPPVRPRGRRPRVCGPSTSRTRTSRASRPSCAPRRPSTSSGRSGSRRCPRRPAWSGSASADARAARRALPGGVGRHADRRGREGRGHRPLRGTADAGIAGVRGGRGAGGAGGGGLKSAGGVEAAAAGTRRGPCCTSTLAGPQPGGRPHWGATRGPGRRRKGAGAPSRPFPRSSSRGGRRDRRRRRGCRDRPAGR